MLIAASETRCMKGKLVICLLSSLHSHHPDGTKVIAVVFWLRKVLQTSLLDSNKDLVSNVHKGTKANDKSCQLMCLISRRHWAVLCSPQAIYANAVALDYNNGLLAAQEKCQSI